VIFVSRSPTGEDLRSAQAIRDLAGVKLLGISERSPTYHGGLFAGLASVASAHDPHQLVSAARTLASEHGALDRIVTTTETLLEPVAVANQALGLKGMSLAIVQRALNKPGLKAALQAAGVATPRDELLKSPEEARRFADSVGLPIVLKPLSGSGGLATWCIRSPDQLELALDLLKPSAQNPILGQEYLQGRELCIDTITVDNVPQFYSLCCYRPSILSALEDAGVQWSCVMPRDIDAPEYRTFIAQGLAAIKALSAGNAMTHMEGFLLEDGGLCFTDATLRPAGARIGPMLGFAYDIDPYKAWARVAVDGCFDGPWERRYAVGTIFLRGKGDGLVEHVEGVESVERQLGELLVDARFPRSGAAKSVSYTGDGYVTVRHPETKSIEDALDFIAETVRVTYSKPESARVAGQHWSERLAYFDKQLYRPAWES